MSLVPSDATRAFVEEELVGARAWATRQGWLLTWVPDALILRAAAYHPTMGRLLELVGDFDGYRAAPPAWRFVRPSTSEVTPQVFPAAGTSTAITGSIFHPQCVICAPWNRLAYVQHGGPHGDWSEPTGWMSLTTQTTATTVGDMLAVIDAHLACSTGMAA